MELADEPEDSAIAASLLFEDIVYATKDSGNSAMSPKSNRTVFPCSSTPKLLASMSGWVNISRSPLIPTGFTGCVAKVKSSVRAWPILNVSGWWTLGKT